MSVKRLSLRIRQDRARRLDAYEALEVLVGESVYRGVESWCCRADRPERHTPVLAAVDVASSVVYEAEVNASRSLGFAQLTSLLGPYLAVQFAFVAQSRGAEPRVLLTELCKQLASGRARRSRA